MSGLPSIRPLTTSADLLTLRDDWERLAARATAANIFLTWDWMTAWYDQYADRGQPHVLAVYDDGELIALAPLTVREHRLSGVPVFRRIAFLGTGLSDRLDVLLAPGRERAALEAIVSHLRSVPWDIVDLEEVPDDSATTQILPGLVVSSGLHVEITPQSVCPVVKLFGEPEAQLASLGKSTRHNLAYYQRRLARTHRIEVEVLRNREGLDEGLAAFLRLYQRCFADRAESALTGAKFAVFRRDVALRFASQGRLLLVLLRVDGAHVAAELTFLYGGTCFAYNGCHDPAWRGEHVGTILQWEVIRHAILARCREYDFLRGAEVYKAHWGSEPRRHVRIQIIRASRKVRMVRAAAHLIQSAPGARLATWARRLW